jgi:GT2 family glycosyltransferase
MLPNLTVPVLNRYDLLERMFESLDYDIQHLLVIDNNPDSRGQATKPDCVERMTWLHMPSNLGVADSWNLAIKSFPHDDRWFFASNDMWYRPGDLERLSEATTDALTLSQHYPYFHTFAVGEAVIDRVGLFDARFYPAFFEDTDFKRRVELAGLPILTLDVAPGHDNSSTLHSDPRFQARNADTFNRNQMLYSRKVAGMDTSFSWSLESRRLGEWLR